MFVGAYFLGLFCVILALPLWLTSAYLAGRLATARTRSGFRNAAWGALTAAVLATGLTGLWFLLQLGALAAAGSRITADTFVVRVPLVLAALAVVLVYGTPRLIRAIREGATADVADPRLVVPIQLNAVVAFLVFYIGWFTPPAPPFWGSALRWWVALLVIAALLTVRQRWRRASAKQRRLSGRVVRGVAGVALIAVAMTGCSVWGAQTSDLPDRHSASGHGDYDLGGGSTIAGLPSAHRHGPVAAGRAQPDLPARSVDDLTEKDLTGPVKRFTLTARTAKIKLPGGSTLGAWTFNGQMPGPELRVRQGDLVEATLVNADIKAGATLHWHGYDVPNAVDGAAGVTQNAVQPGQRHVYRFKARYTGTYWYHSHQQSSDQVRRGLFGALIVEPRQKTGNQADIPVLLHQWDKDVAPDQAQTYNSSDRPQHQRVAPGTPVRLRLINSSDNARPVAVSGTPYRVVAIDGQDLNQPGEIRRQKLDLAGGGRFDVTFTMPSRPVAVSRFNGVKQDQPGLILSPDGKGQPPAEKTTGSFDPLTYGVRGTAPYGPGTKYDRKFTLNIDNSMGFFDGKLVQRYRVNGRVFPDIPTLAVRRGETVKTTFVNRSYSEHPMHLHGHHMLVLARNGKRATGSPWWTDTLNVAPGEIVEVAFTANNPGLWMDHCHNLPHAKAGMMLHLAYEGVTSPYQTGRKTPNQPE